MNKTGRPTTTVELMCKKEFLELPEAQDGRRARVCDSINEAKSEQLVSSLQIEGRIEEIEDDLARWCEIGWEEGLGHLH